MAGIDNQNEQQRVRLAAELLAGRPVLMTFLLESTIIGTEVETRVGVVVSEEFTTPDLETTIAATIRMTINLIESSDCGSCPVCTGKLDRLNKALGLIEGGRKFDA